MDETHSPGAFSPPTEFSRKHGLQLPLNIYQIFSWLVLFFELCSTYLVLLPPLNLVLRIISGVIISLLMTLTCYYGAKATLSDPTDPAVLQERKAKENNENYRSTLKLFCVICQTHVQPRTKHCGICNRCVNIFDHHCIWLNNCIGEANYKYFIRTIVLLFVAVVAKLGFGLLVVVNFHLFTDDFQQNSRNFYGVDGDFAAIHHLMIVSCIVNASLFLLLSKLIHLHIWLHKKGLTTYESIVMKRMKSQQKKEGKEGEPVAPKKSRVIKDLEDESSSTIPARLRNPHGISQTESEIRLDSHSQEASPMPTRSDNSPMLKGNRTEPSGETARFETSPFIQSHHKAIQNNKKKSKHASSIFNNETKSLEIKQGILIKSRDPSPRGISMIKGEKRSETFAEEEKQGTQKDVRLDMSGGLSPLLNSDNSKSISAYSHPESSASLTKSWSGKKLFQKNPKLSRVFSSDINTQSPSPSSVGDSKTPGFTRNLEEIGRESMHFTAKSYQKINVFNFVDEVRKLEQKSARSLASPCFGGNVEMVENKHISENNMLTQSIQIDIRQGLSENVPKGEVKAKSEMDEKQSQITDKSSKRI